MARARHATGGRREAATDEQAQAACYAASRTAVGTSALAARASAYKVSYTV